MPDAERNYYQEAIAIIEETSPYIPRREHLIALWDKILMIRTGASLTLEMVAEMRQLLAERKLLMEQIDTDFGRSNNAEKKK